MVHQAPVVGSAIKAADRRGLTRAVAASTCATSYPNLTGQRGRPLSRDFPPLAHSGEPHASPGACEPSVRA